MGIPGELIEMQVLILQGGGGGTESLTSSQVIGGCSSADQILSRQNPRGLSPVLEKTTFRLHEGQVLAHA